MIRRPDIPDEDGTAIAEFVMVGAFVLIPLFLALLQLALVLYSRNIVVASAAVGARRGASADSTAAVGGRAACDSIKAALPRAEGLTCTGSTVAGPVELVEVRVSGPIPMFFLPWGRVSLDVSGHAVKEVAP